jgi:hypothetical protein
MDDAEEDCLGGDDLVSEESDMGTITLCPFLSFFGVCK